MGINGFDGFYNYMMTSTIVASAKTKILTDKMISTPGM